MEKFFHSTFDFFSHALPGILMLGSFYILDTNYNNLDDFIEKANQVDVGGAVLILLIGYVIGFACYPIGRYTYKKLAEWFAKDDQQFRAPSDLANQFTLVREKSPANFKYIEAWNMFCAMSHNLACWALFTVMLGAYRVIHAGAENKSYWGIFCVIFFVLFVIFIHRAYTFSKWAKVDMVSTCEKIKNREIG